MTEAPWAALTPAEAWTPYGERPDAPWDARRAAHLLRRAGFGYTSRQLSDAVKRGPEATVKSLVESRPDAAFEKTVESLADAVLAGGEPRNLSSWWLYRMLHSPALLLERMTMFWHGHFATSGAKVVDARALLAQHRLFYDHALGDFRVLAQGIARDPAMLLYLDSATNRRSHPNENFARELLELFCLGLGAYSERDIQELARCFTGWEVRNGTFRFNRYQHDRGEKEFLGRRGAFTGEQAVDVVLEQPAVATFLVRKLVQEFVADEPALDDAYLAPLVERFRSSSLSLSQLMTTVLGSRLMLERPPIGAKVRSPVEYAVGWLRSMEATTNLQLLADDLGQMGQRLFFPPNVKGWPGGRAWINSTTLAGRANLVRRLLTDGSTKFGGASFDDWLGRQSWPDAAAQVDGLIALWFAVPPSPAARAELSRLTPASGIAHAMSLLPEMSLT